MNGDRFRELSAELGLNQIELGNTLGLSRQSVNRIMQGNQGLTDTVVRLLAALITLKRNGMMGEYEKLLDEYHNVTHNEVVNTSHEGSHGNE